MQIKDKTLAPSPSPRDGFDEINLIKEMINGIPNSFKTEKYVVGIDFDMDKIDRAMDLIQKLVEDNF